MDPEEFAEPGEQKASARGLGWEEDRRRFLD